MRLLKYMIVPIILLSPVVLHAQFQQSLVLSSEQTEFVQEEVALNTVLLQLFREHMYSIIPGTVLPLDNWLQVMQEVEDAIRFDIVSALELSESRQLILRQYINHMQNLLSQGQRISDMMTVGRDVFFQDMQECAVLKLDSDAQVMDALLSYNQQGRDRNVALSAKYESCIGDNRVQANARTIAVQRMNYMLGILQNRYDLLQNKYALIVQYFDILKTDLLEELHAIAVQLEQFDAQ